MSTTISKKDKTLYDIQDFHRRKTWLIPDWQREGYGEVDVWSPAKKKNFKQDILNKIDKGGDILTTPFTLVKTKESDQLYINDGLQRSKAVVELYDELEKQYGNEKSKEMLEKIECILLTKECENEYDAKMDFQTSNLGTPLTDANFGHVILTCLPNYQDWKRYVFDPIHKNIDECLAQCGIKDRRESTSSKISNNIRDHLSMFLRYLSKEKERKNYDFKIKLLGTHSSIEQMLIDKMQGIGIEECKNQAKAFNKYIESTSASINDIWNKLDKSKMRHGNLTTIQPSMFRWLLHFFIYKKNNAIPQEQFEDAVTKILIAGKGTVRIIIDSEKDLTLGLNRAYLSRLNSLEKDLDLNIEVKRKKQDLSQVPRGHDVSHIEAFSKVGEGDVIPLPSLKNKSMGTQTLESCEK